MDFTSILFNDNHTKQLLYLAYGIVGGINTALL